MGVYVRGGKLWLNYTDASGTRKYEPTGLRVGEEAKAKKALAIIKRRVEAEKSTGIPTGELTVQSYGEKWLKARPGQGVASAADEESRMRLHVFPLIGNILLKDLRPRHIREAFRTIRKKLSARGELLAPRSIRNAYGTLHTMLHDAEVDDLIDKNPCLLKKGDLPKKKDKDPGWRAKAIFDRAEVELLISDPRIPEDRRIVTALEFLGAMRFGEAAALRWKNYDETRKPLGCLHLVASWDTKKKIVTTTKTEEAREVPVHPVLAEILRRWKTDGWRRLLGRNPTPDDLIIPSRSPLTEEPNGTHRNVNHALRKFHEDLERVGLRKRAARLSRCLARPTSCPTARN